MATLITGQQWVSLFSPEDARSGTVHRIHPECWCETDGSAKTDLGVTSEEEEQLQTSKLIVLNSPALGQSSLRFFSPIIFVPSFPCWRSVELSSLPVCKPHRVLHLNIFLLPAPCCSKGLGHDGAFHPSFPVMIQSWWLLASALRVSGLL